MLDKTRWIDEYREEITGKFEELQWVKKIEERVELLQRLAFLYNEVKEHEESEKYCEILLQLCQENGLKRQYAQSLYLAGYNSFSMDRYGVALEYYYEALPLYKNYFKKQEIGKLLNEMGRNYSRVNNNAKAREFYEEAIIKNSKILSDHLGDREMIVGLAQFSKRKLKSRKEKIEGRQ
jgi:tetratricopeptide (TPR) repeat protein